MDTYLCAMQVPHKLSRSFYWIPNAAATNSNDRPMMQKELYAVSPALQQYLQQYKKDNPLPLAYTDLLHYEYTNAIKNDKGKHTHWEKVIYKEPLLSSLKTKLAKLYALLTNDSNIAVNSIDFCEYANSMPFRINITHTQNNQQGSFYIKAADASRIYGLLMEQLLTHNPINFLYHHNTLVEAQIDGVAGDTFLEEMLHFNKIEKIALAKAFILFNENCFVRLLGDMRSYNFVVVKNKTPQMLFTIKAIDFDQQCYEGRLNLYLPQFYKENYGYVQLVTSLLSETEINDIRQEARKQLASLFHKNQLQINQLLQVMEKEELSEPFKVVSLQKELNQYHHSTAFTHCNSMGKLVKAQLQAALL